MKEWCEEKDVLFQTLHSYGGTRFVAMKKVIERVLQMYEPLTEYFKGINKPPVILAKFFADPLNRFILQFVRDACENFEATILRIEKEEITAVEAVIHVRNLKRLLQQHLEDRFLSISASMELENAIGKVEEDEENDNKITEEEVWENVIEPFYGRCLFRIFI